MTTRVHAPRTLDSTQNSCLCVADLIHKLKAKFPNATITHNGGLRWIGGILYVDDLCLISTDALEFQLMINTCQT